MSPFASIDVLLCIIDYLEVLSVVRLAMLRRDIRSNRGVWLRIIRNMMEAECIMPHTFPLGTMSLEDLEACAMRPLRARGAFMQDRIADPSQQRFRLILPSKPHSAPWMRGQNIYLIPGGRWLISTASDGNHVHLFCWDLSTLPAAGDHDISHLSPVAKIIFEGTRTGLDVLRGEAWCELSAQSDSIRSRVIILVSYSTNAEVRTTTHVISHLNWNHEDDSQPSFSEVTSIDVSHHDRDHFKLDGGTVIFVNKYRMIIWDWSTGTWGQADISEGDWKSCSIVWFSLRAQEIHYRLSYKVILTFKVMLSC